MVRYSWKNNMFCYYFSWISLFWNGYKLHKKHHFDVIHAESPHISGIAAVMLGKLFHIKIIVEYRVSYRNNFV